MTARFISKTTWRFITVDKLLNYLIHVEDKKFINQITTWTFLHMQACKQYLCVRKIGFFIFVHRQSYKIIARKLLLCFFKNV